MVVHLDVPTLARTTTLTTTISLDSLKLTAQLRRQVLHAAATYDQRCHLRAALAYLRDTQADLTLLLAGQAATDTARHVTSSQLKMILKGVCMGDHFAIPTQARTWQVTKEAFHHRFFEWHEML